MRLDYPDTIRESTLRKAGQLEDPSLKDGLEQVLVSKGIPFEIEPHKQGLLVWVENEEHLEQARAIIDDYHSNPNSDNMSEAKKEGSSLQRQHRQQQTINKIEQRGRRLTLSGASGNVSRSMIGLSVTLFIIRELQPSLFNSMIPWVLIFDPNRGQWGGLSSGELWRLWTPMFWHMGILHLLFNCWWMWDLGRGVERYLGSLKFLALVSMISIPAHFAQAMFYGPLFGGLSGVVYGLLGYVYWTGKRNPHSPLQLPQQTMIFMMAWLILGIVAIPNIANGVHLVGLAMGVLIAQLKSSR